MAQAPVLYGTNLLETGTVSVSGASTAQPATRLYDRDIGLYWSDTGTAGTRYVAVDMGSGQTGTLTTLAIAPGHNLSGLTLTLDWSTSAVSASSWTNATTTTGNSGTVAQLITSSSLTKRSFRLGITGAATAPSISELLFTTGYTFPGIPMAATPQSLQIPATVEQVSIGNYAWNAKLGNDRVGYSYEWRRLTSAQRDALVTFWQSLQSGTQFAFLTDAEGTTRWVSLKGQPLNYAGEPMRSGPTWDITLRFEEAI